MKTRAGAWLLAAVLSMPAAGQGGARPVDAAPAPPSRWAAESAALDDALRSRLLTAGDARANWVAGQLDRGDIASQVSHFAAARVAEPQNRLYLATLAMACLERVQTPLPECDAVDRLADWATRETDNGLPSMLLAERARRRRDVEAMQAHLANAAAQPRFDDYWAVGTLALWETVRALPVPADDAAKLTLVAGYDAARAVYWPAAVRSACLGAAAPPDTIRAACAQAGERMWQDGAMWTARLQGGAIVARNAATQEKRTAAEQRMADLRFRIAACSRAVGALVDGLESADAGVRARAVASYDRWLRREAAVGEVRACDEIGAGGK
jgi:hypothetical protein